MNKKFYIGNIPIGSGERPLVIPEIGINHSGSLETAFAIVRAAHRAGARLIKHQTHVVADEMAAAAKNVIPGNANISIYDIMSSCALDESEELELMKYTQSLGMEFLSTPFSRAAADRLEHFGVKAYKIGSGEMNNEPLIEHIASFQKPMIVSTGMNDLRSIDRTVNILEKHRVPYALLHTTNIYPTPAKLIRLGAMQELHNTYPEIPFGLSDHSLNNHACIAAMTLGASIVERHFTDTMDREGPDICCSMDETTCRELILAAKEIPQMTGGAKQALAEEQPTIDFAFATIVSTSPIQSGETLTAQNLWVKRPGKGGIPARYYNEILGKKAITDIPADIQLSPSMIQDFPNSIDR